MTVKKNKKLRHFLKHTKKKITPTILANAVIKIDNPKPKKKKISIAEAERITGGLDLWGQSENFTPPNKDKDLRLPLVVRQQKHNNKLYDFVIHYPDGNKEGVNIKSKEDKAKVNLQLELDNLQKSSAVTGNTTVAMSILKKWAKETDKIKDALIPKTMQEIAKGVRNEQKALQGIMGLKILEKFGKPRTIMTTPINPKGETLLGGYIPPVNPFTGKPEGTMIKPPKPQAHAREPLTGAGMRRFMELMKIDNPVLIAKKYPKNQKALNISGFINLRFLCESMNVSVEDAFLYICEGMQKTNKRWLKHRIELEFFRGSISIVNLVNYFREKIEHNKKRHIAKYTLKQLYKSEYFTNFCQVNYIEFKSYTDFTRHFKRWKHHVEVLIDKKKPKGLLN